MLSFLYEETGVPKENILCLVILYGLVESNWKHTSHMWFSGFKVRVMRHVFLTD